MSVSSLRLAVNHVVPASPRSAPAPERPTAQFGQDQVKVETKPSKLKQAVVATVTVASGVVAGAAAGAATTTGLGLVMGGPEMIGILAVTGAAMGALSGGIGSIEAFTHQNRTEAKDRGTVNGIKAGVLTGAGVAIAGRRLEAGVAFAVLGALAGLVGGRAGAGVAHRVNRALNDSSAD